MNEALSGMKEIQEFCKEIKLQWSERRILEMHNDDGFPMRKLGGSWESDRTAIIEWRKARLKGDEVRTVYVEERDVFIPMAEKWANLQHGAARFGASEAELNTWRAAWSQCFHQRMSELWAGWTDKKQAAAKYADEERERIYQAKLKELQEAPSPKPELKARRSKK